MRLSQRSPCVYLIAKNMAIPQPKAKRATTTAPSVCTPMEHSVPLMAGLTKTPVRMVPTMPPTPCTLTAPTGSSMWSFLSMKLTDIHMMMEVIMPMTALAHMSTQSHPAVMPTNPANTPLQSMEREGFPSTIQVYSMAEMPPVAAAMLVVTKMCDMATALAYPVAATVEQGLNPNHPTQRQNTPRAQSTRL